MFFVLKGIDKKILDYDNCPNCKIFQKKIEQIEQEKKEIINTLFSIKRKFLKLQNEGNNINNISKINKKTEGDLEKKKNTQDVKKEIEELKEKIEKNNNLMNMNFKKQEQKSIKNIQLHLAKQKKILKTINASQEKIEKLY